MPAEDFAHLHVASGHSLRYGTSHPHVLVERAVEHGMGLLALTDRDGTYGAVKFAKAAQAAGIAPVLVSGSAAPSSWSRSMSLRSTVSFSPGGSAGEAARRASSGVA